MKRLIGILIAAAMALMLPVSSLAATAGQFLRGNYEIEGDTLQMLCTELPDDGTLSVTVGTQKDVSAQMTTVKEAGLPTTVYCLIDVSGSMSERQMQDAKDAMLAISAAMDDGDNMVITLLGDTVDIGDILETPEQRTQAIEALDAESDYTNLYKGMADSIALLETSTKYNQNCCLVILSDGVDDHQTGFTEEEAMSAIQGSIIPVYAVAVLPENADEAAQESGKLLRSFGTASLGGSGYTTGADGMTGTQIGETIWNSMQNCRVMQIQLDALEPDRSKDTLLLKASYETADAKYEDTATIYTADLPEGNSDSNLDPVPSTEAEESEEEDEEEKEKTDLEMLIILIIVIAVIAVTAIAVVLALNGKKKKEAEELRKKEETEREEAERKAKEELERKEKEAAARARQEEENRNRQAAKKGKPECRLHLTAIGYPDRTYDIQLARHDAKTIGRTSKADIVLDSNDTKLSGVHCEMEWDGARLFARDADSTNGTFINGVPLKGKSWQTLENGAAIRIGGYEYRIEMMILSKQQGIDKK